MKTVDVEVTQKDIYKGIRSSDTYCPVARAIGRALREPVRVYGFNWQIEIPWNYRQAHRDESLIKGQMRPLPTKVATWIKRFDKGETVNQIKFQIAIEDEPVE